MHRPILHIGDILAWADDFRARIGRWPMRRDGKIVGQLGLTWSAVDQALKKGNRGLRPGSSLAKLLREHRGRRHKGLLPCFTLDQILTWADAHHARTDTWPCVLSGPIPEAPRETWLAVDKALRKGGRGLPGGSSLAQLLESERGVRNQKNLPLLSVEQVLAWADAHHDRTGSGPTPHSGTIPEAPDETWQGLNQSLHAQTRGLSGYGSLAILLARHRGTRHLKQLPDLSIPEILAWADAYHARIGKWPKYTSGSIPESAGETWGGVHHALYHGGRGHPGGSSLAQLLAEQRSVRNKGNLPSLTVEQILVWADAHQARTGRWPTRHSGPIAEARGETWSSVNSALVAGYRGLAGGSSLVQLLARKRGVPIQVNGSRRTLHSRQF